MTLNDPCPSIKVTPFFDAEYLRNCMPYRHRDLHTPYPTLSFPMILSDLAKYSVTRSVSATAELYAELFDVE